MEQDPKQKGTWTQKETALLYTAFCVFGELFFLVSCFGTMPAALPAEVLVAESLEVVSVSHLEEVHDRCVLGQ